MLGSYRRLFDGPEPARLVAASVFARLAIGAFSLPLLLAVQQAKGSFAAAGLVGGAFSAGVALAAPLRGRLIDRRGARAAVPAMALLSGAALALVALLAEAAPTAGLAALAAASGASTPPLVASMRLEWQRMLGMGDARLGAAYALEAGVQTAVFVVGPLLAGAAIAAAGARATLAAVAAVLVAGCAVFARLARAAPEPAVRGAPSPIRRPGVVTLVAATVLADVGLGGIDVIVTAFAEERGRPELAGALLAMVAAGAVVGALAYGARPRRLAPTRQLVAVSLAGAAAIAVLALPGSFLVLGALLLVAGAPSAAHWTASSIALDHASGGRAGAEAYTWLSTANAIGVGLGTVAGGAAVERWGTATAFLLVAAGPALAAVAVAARRATLSVPARGALDGRRVAAAEQAGVDE